MYARLDLAEAWAIIGPLNWYGASSNLKLMFDRLVCMNGGNPKEELIDHKNPEKAMALEHSAQWEDLSVNHLEGRSAGFFCYGDEGGESVRPRVERPHELRLADHVLRLVVAVGEPLARGAVRPEVVRFGVEPRLVTQFLRPPVSSISLPPSSP